jgi:transposase-like protein
MAPAIPRDPIYRGRRFSHEVIELCVRWYITYQLSYRDLVAMMADRGITVSHTTIMRWVLRYVPEYERKWAQFARPPGSSWRVDETAISIAGGYHFLYRAVDKNGGSVASLLRPDRTIGSARAFFRAAVAQKHIPWPAKINLDGNAATYRGLLELGEEDPRWKTVEIRARRYLNNVIEQDHRAIKRRCASMLGLKTLKSASITLAGIELAHRIRKGQHAVPLEPHGKVVSLRDAWDRVLSQECTPPSQQGFPPSSMHQISPSPSAHLPRGARKIRHRRLAGYRHAWRLPFGNGLYLLVTTKGGRIWRYRYRHDGKPRSLALGTYPHVPLEAAITCHRYAQELLAAGIVPALRRIDIYRYQPNSPLAAQSPGIAFSRSSQVASRHA